MVKKHWTKARLKTSWTNCKLCFSISYIKMLFRCPTTLSFVDGNIQLSLETLPLPVSSFSWQVSHCSGISNMLGFPRQSRFQLCNLTPPFRHTLYTCLTSVGFVSHRSKFHSPHFCPYLPKPHGQSFQVLLLAGSGTCLPCSITSLPTFLFFMVSITA